MKQQNKILMGLMSAVALTLGAQQSGAAVIDVSGGIGADETWTASNEYRLMNPVFVTNGATLTIDAGTVVRGANNGLGVAPGALIISRGSKIRAMGTAANPIVFTDFSDDNIGANPGTGIYANKDNQFGKNWGGVILLGRTYLATNVGEPGTPSPSAGLQVQIEGLASYGDDSKYGGGNDDDNSGEMHFCSIRYGGYILGAANEINGLTLGAVGRGTQIDHIEVFRNADDDFEFFGGTVNMKYIVAWSSMDDGFDTDEGYRGKGQFFLRVQGSSGITGEKSDKGTEEDGGIAEHCQPSSIPTWYNWTQVGHGKASGKKNNTGIMMRDGTGGRFYNGLWMDFGGAPAMVQGSVANVNTNETADKFVANYVNNSYYTHEAVGFDGVQSKKAEMKYNIFWNFGTNAIPAFDVGVVGAATWGADTHNGNPTNFAWGTYPLFTDVALKNFYVEDPAIVCPVTAMTRMPNAGAAGYTNIATLNPLLLPAYGNTIMTLGRVPPNDGFFTPVNFIGAFGKTNNWAAGWTLASRFGLLTGGSFGDYTGVVPAVRVDSTNLQVSLSCDVYAGINADFYVLADAGDQGWFRYDLTLGQWASCNIAAPAPSLANAPLGDIPWMTIIPTTSLQTGKSYNIFFVVDTVPGNNKLDMDRLYVGMLIGLTP